MDPNVNCSQTPLQLYICKEKNLTPLLSSLDNSEIIGKPLDFHLKALALSTLATFCIKKRSVLVPVLGNTGQ